MATTEQTADCRRCGRALHSAEAIARGYGRTCWRKVREAANVVVDLAAWKAEQIAKAAEAIEDGAVIRLRGRIFLVVSTDGTETYRTAATGHCNCPAGLKGRRCFHTAAALIADAA
jgi:hypothetical protein